MDTKVPAVRLMPSLLTVMIGGPSPAATAGTNLMSTSILARFAGLDEFQASMRKTVSAEGCAENVPGRIPTNGTNSDVTPRVGTGIPLMVTLSAFFVSQANSAAEVSTNEQLLPKTGSLTQGVTYCRPRR